jgi:hypothetical protein
MPGIPKVIPLQAHPRARSRDESGAALDLVAQLFEHLARDAALPQAVREELARLRIPALRAVQLAPDFAGQRLHPARRLLDAIGAVALGLDDAVGADDASVRAIANAVHAVLVDFDADVRPFDAAAAALEEFAAQRARDGDEAARPMVQAIVQRETADLPRRAALEEVERRLRARLWVPKAVRAMLCGPWAEVLAAEYRQNGEGSQAWHARVRTMDELLWSVEPKGTAEGRKRLGAVLPELVDALSDGFERAQLADEERSAFLSELVDCHANAMKAGLRGLALVPEGEPPRGAQAPELAATTFDAGTRRVEEIRLVSAKEAPGDAHDDAVVRLRLGAWIDLARGARAPARKRLAWSSPITGALLLVGLAPTSIGVSISPDALAEKLRRGDAHILDATPLVDRAMLALAARPAPQG